MSCPHKPAGIFPPTRSGSTKEELPDLSRERVPLVVDSLPGGGHAAAELIPPSFGVDDGRQVRESFTVVSEPRQGYAGADDVE